VELVFQCAHAVNKQINTRPQLSAVGRSEKTREITWLCCTTRNAEQNPRCFSMKVFFLRFVLIQLGAFVLRYRQFDVNLVHLSVECQKFPAEHNVHKRDRDECHWMLHCKTL